MTDVRQRISQAAHRTGRAFDDQPDACAGLAWSRWSAASATRSVMRLRRILLSSMDGWAVVEVEIQGVQHEYTTIAGVQEDVLEILLNLKHLSISLHSRKRGNALR
jgi:hypothetical protein